MNANAIAKNYSRLTPKRVYEKCYRRFSFSGGVVRRRTMT